MIKHNIKIRIKNFQSIFKLMQLMYRNYYNIDQLNSITIYLLQITNARSYYYYVVDVIIFALLSFIRFVTVYDRELCLVGYSRILC